MLLMSYKSMRQEHCEPELNIIVPAAVAGVVTAGIATIPAAAVSAYWAHAFEKNFWDYIKKTWSELGKGTATMSDPVAVTQ
jgi:hypothetical protein